MTESQLNLRQSFWDFMTNTKFDLCYYDIQQRKSLTISRLLTWTPKIITSAAAATWMQWPTNTVVNSLCPIAIFLMQLCEIVVANLPFKARFDELRELIDEIMPEYREIESNWRMMEAQEKPYEEVPRLISEYTSKIDTIKRHYLKDDALPQTASQKALQATKEYFATF